jgi:MOSC domain-containing protein YiiM
VKVISVNAGYVERVGYSKQGRSAIDKRPQPGRVAVTALGLVVDEQGDKRHHGGIDKALYAVAREELDWWSEELGRPLRDGQFGENLTTLGVEVDDAVIGERWRVGTTLLEVSMPRIPCSTFQGFLAEPRWVKRFTHHARPGAYLRVLERGEIGAGDGVEMISRPADGVTIAQSFCALTGVRT